MCYSAQIAERFQAYIRRFGAVIDIHEFVRRYGMRADGAPVKFPRGVDQMFLSMGDADLQPIQELIRAWDAAEITRLEQEMFRQRRRVSDAERALQAKETKKSREDIRIGTRKVVHAQRRLTALQRTEPTISDLRIFPGLDAPLLVLEEGKLVVRPMRYQCRPAGKPAFYDRKYPGTYNARRDNLTGFWKGEFGQTHGVLIIDRFYENVEDSTGQNVVLEFEPQDKMPMFVACLWSRWVDPKAHDPDLLSFAAITDEPPPEVAAAGHDRCVVPLRPEHVTAWLSPDGREVDELQGLLDDRDDLTFEHRAAA